MTKIKRFKYKLACTLGITSLFLTCGMGVSLAEEVRIPVGHQAENLAISTPKMGATKAQVETQFGTPLSTTEPVGKPPISSWEYADFIVYFEYDHVIHSVKKLKTQQSAQP